MVVRVVVVELDPDVEVVEETAVVVVGTPVVVVVVEEDGELPHAASPTASAASAITAAPVRPGLTLNRRIVDPFLSAPATPTRPPPYVYPSTGEVTPRADRHVRPSSPDRSNGCHRSRLGLVSRFGAREAEHLGIAGRVESVDKCPHRLG